jgi:hypothetical protein
MDKRLVKVTWVDASDPPGETSWYSDKEVDDFAAAVCEVVSVGYIKSDTKLYLTLVADYIVNDNGTITWGRPTKIPHGMVTKVEELSVEHHPTQVP